MPTQGVTQCPEGGAAAASSFRAHRGNRPRNHPDSGYVPFGRNVGKRADHFL
jgi:hypothetical protein